MRSARLPFFAALLLLGCGRTTESTGQSTAPSTASVTPVIASGAPSAATTADAPNAPPAANNCDALFAPPPNAEPLCNEHIRGMKEEIHFRSWGTSEDRVGVNQRYHKPASDCRFGVTTKPPIFSVTKGNLRLSTHEASDKTGYPTCSVPPKPTHKTVIVISDKTDFGK